MVTRNTFSFLSLLLILAVPMQTWAAVSARVDKTIINQDETLNLTLLIDKSGARAPDLEGLEKDFYIVGTNQSSRHMYTNGKSQSSTEWFINLIPQHTGRAVIPSFIIEGQQTKAINIQVKAAGASTDNDLQPIFIESEVNKEQVFVQEQLSYTIRVSYAIQIEKARLPDPALINASFKKIGENSFDKTIKGMTYRVFERTYAIFPQQIGELVIPPVLFSAMQSTGRQSMYRMQQSGSPIRKLSKQHKVTVKAPPASFRGETWLPAKSLKLVETWSRNPRELRVGESITRTITTNAQNLLDAQLPPVIFDSVAGFKLYPDQGSLKSIENVEGVYSSRVDSTALIATREGELVLPAIRLRWWDTSSSRSRVAVIPETKLNIKPALEEPINIVAPRAVDHSKQKSSPPAVMIQETNLWWKISSAILLALWLLSLFFYFRLRGQLRSEHNPSSQTEKPEKTLNEKKAFRQLSKAARGTDLLATRSAAIFWANCYWPDQTINSLDDIKLLSDHASLGNAMSQLDAALYGNESSKKNWNGDSLIGVIKLIRQKKEQQQGRKNTLDPLYKNNA